MVADVSILLMLNSQRTTSTMAGMNASVKSHTATRATVSATCPIDAHLLASTPQSYQTAYCNMRTADSSAAQL